jgi:hypothetical protein
MFSYYFCLMIEGSGSGSIPLNNGSGSRRLKNMWIRWIRIRNTVRNIAVNTIRVVEEGRQQFHREMASIMPDVKLGEKNSRLTEDELNMFITHAYRKVSSSAFSSCGFLPLHFYFFPAMLQGLFLANKQAKQC